MSRIKGKNSKFIFFFSLIFALTFCCLSEAKASEVTINDTLLKAICTNPEIQAKWHSFAASEKELASARGGYLPRLDLTAGLGRENLDGAGYEGRDMQNYTRDGITLSLNQMIYDGSLTTSKVKKYSHSQKMRYFNLVSSIEQIALAALRSHEDVLRYQTLVIMAKGNLDRHQEIMNKIEERTKSGVDSKVNLETTKGRLALARVNLMTEESNLHDSTTQYIRIVGENPGEKIINASINIDVPKNIDSVIEEMLAGNPQLSAYNEQVKSMSFAVNEQKSKMHPRLDLRASTNFENDVDGVEGRRDKGVIELILRYNLFNGGSDKADIERQIELYKESQENKNKAERDIRQIALVSYNDIVTLQRQLHDLDQHRRSADNTRLVYGKQFEAGRRSLLDLLDAENEYFQADRAYANAEFNLVIAKASYLAAGGNLLQYFNIFDGGLPTPQQISLEINRDAILPEVSNKP